MNSGKSKSCEQHAVQKPNQRRRHRHTSQEKGGKKSKEDTQRKQDKKVLTESDDDSSTGTLFAPVAVKKLSASTSKPQKKVFGQRERVQLENKLQLINRCLECLKKQKWKVMQQLEDLDNGDSDDDE